MGGLVYGAAVRAEASRKGSLELETDGIAALVKEDLEPDASSYRRRDREAAGRAGSVIDERLVEREGADEGLGRRCVADKRSRSSDHCEQDDGPSAESIAAEFGEP
jgi:hypothetical protein